MCTPLFVTIYFKMLSAIKNNAYYQSFSSPRGQIKFGSDEINLMSTCNKKQLFLEMHSADVQSVMFTAHYNPAVKQGWWDVLSLMSKARTGGEDNVFSTTLELFRAVKKAFVAWMKALYEVVSEVLGPAVSTLIKWIKVVQEAFMALMRHCGGKFSSFYPFWSSVCGTEEESYRDKQIMQDEVDTARARIEEMLGSRKATYDSGERSDEELSDSELQNGNEKDLWYNRWPERASEMMSQLMQALVNFAEKAGAFVGNLHTSSGKIVSSWARMYIDLEKLNVFTNAKRLWNWIYFKITGTNYYVEFELIQRYKLLAARLEKYLAIIEPMRNPTQTLQEAIAKDLQEFVALYPGMLEYRPRELALVTAQYRELKARAEPYASIRRGSNRVKPVVLVMNGPAGCGKTWSQKYIVDNLMKYVYASFDPTDAAADMPILAQHAEQATAFSINCLGEKEKFEDGYNDPLFYCMEEYLTSSSQTDREKWATYFMKVCDHQPLLLNFAFGDKGKRYFCSPFIIATGNFQNHETPFADPNAYYRRIELDLTAKRLVVGPGETFHPTTHTRFFFSQKNIEIIKSPNTPSPILLEFILARPNLSSDGISLSELVKLMAAIYIDRITLDAPKLEADFIPEEEDLRIRENMKAMRNQRVTLEAQDEYVANKVIYARHVASGLFDPNVAGVARERDDMVVTNTPRNDRLDAAVKRFISRHIRPDSISTTVKYIFDMQFKDNIKASILKKEQCVLWIVATATCVRAHKLNEAQTNTILRINSPIEITNEEEWVRIMRDPTFDIETMADNLASSHLGLEDALLQYAIDHGYKTKSMSLSESSNSEKQGGSEEDPFIRAILKVFTMDVPAMVVHPSAGYNAAKKIVTLLIPYLPRCMDFNRDVTPYGYYALMTRYRPSFCKKVAEWNLLPKLTPNIRRELKKQAKTTMKQACRAMDSFDIYNKAIMEKLNRLEMPKLFTCVYDSSVFTDIMRKSAKYEVIREWKKDLTPRGDFRDIPLAKRKKYAQRQAQNAKRRIAQREKQQVLREGRRAYVSVAAVQKGERGRQKKKTLIRDKQREEKYGSTMTTLTNNYDLTFSTRCQKFVTEFLEPAKWAQMMLIPELKYVGWRPAMFVPAREYNLALLEHHKAYVKKVIGANWTSQEHAQFDQDMNRPGLRCMAVLTYYRSKCSDCTSITAGILAFMMSRQESSFSTEFEEHVMTLRSLSDTSARRLLYKFIFNDVRSAPPSWVDDFDDQIHIDDAIDANKFNTMMKLLGIPVTAADNLAMQKRIKDKGKPKEPEWDLYVAIATLIAAGAAILGSIGVMIYGFWKKNKAQNALNDLDKALVELDEEAFKKNMKLLEDMGYEVYKREELKFPVLENQSAPPVKGKPPKKLRNILKDLTDREERAKAKAAKIASAPSIKNGLNDHRAAKIARNSYAVLTPSGHKMCSVSVVCGAIVRWNKHCFDSAPDTFVLLSFEDTPKRIPIKVKKNACRVIQEYEDADCCLVDMSDYLRPHSDIRNFYITEEMLQKQRGFSRGFISYFEPELTKGDADPLGHFLVQMEPRQLDAFAQDCIVGRWFIYQWNKASRGSCGSTDCAMIDNEIYIVGHHAAGGVDGTYGIGAVVTRDMLKCCDPEELRKMSVPTVTQFASISLMDTDEAHGLYDYDTERKVFLSPGKTDATDTTCFVPTPFSTHLFRGSVPVAPAALDREALNNTRIKEHNAIVTPVDYSEAHELIDEFKEYIFEKAFPCALEEINGCVTLSTQEVLDADYGLRKHDVNTSRGASLRAWGIEKKQLLGYADQLYDPEARALFYSKIEKEDALRRQGHYLYQTACDKLKDELRDLLRVQQKKTRPFCVTDYKDNVQIQRGIGHFVSKTKQFFFISPACCGVNPKGSMWGHIYREFRGHKVVFTDVSGFDFTHFLGLMIFFRYLILTVYTGFWDRMDAYWSVMSCICALRFNMGVGRFNGKGNTSGNWITTWFNTLSNLVYFSVVCVHLARKNGDDPVVALRQLKVRLYSDDNLSSCPYSWWTAANISATFKKLYGITLTSVDKGEVDDENGVGTIDDAEFLSRKFVSRKGQIFAPLSLDSLFSQLYFVRMPKGEKFNKNLMFYQLQQNLDNVVLELYEYSDEERQVLTAELQDFISAHKLPLTLKDLDMDPIVYREYC